MIHAILFLLSLAAFSCLALAMERHQRDLLKKVLPPMPTRLLRGTGWALLLCTALLAVMQLGTGFGLASLSGHTSVAAGVVVLAMVSYQRRKG